MIMFPKLSELLNALKPPVKNGRIDIQERLKERRDEWETISFHNVHTRKVTWEDCVQISHGFGAICPDCKHAPKCFAKRCRYG
jgi:hypothetical protein